MSDDKNQSAKNQKAKNQSKTPNSVKPTPLFSRVVAKARAISKVATAKIRKLAVQTKQSIKTMTKKQYFLVSTTTTLIVAGGVMISLALFTNQASTKTVSSEATKSRLGVSVMLVNGAANYQRGDKLSPLFNDTELKEGDKVQTLSNGRVTLTLDDGSVLRLDVSTTVKLVSLEEGSVEVDHQSGVVYSRVVNGNYSLQVEEDRYKALGTAFFTRNQKDLKGIQVIESKVKTKSDLELAEGDQYYTLHPNEDLVGQASRVDPISLTEDEFAWWNMLEDERSELFKNKLGIFEIAKQLSEERENARLEAEAIAKAEQEARDKQAQENEDQRNKIRQSDNLPSVAEGIFLSASVDGSKVNLSWTADGVDAPRGFVMTYSSKSEEPVYGKASHVVIKDGEDREYSWRVARKDREKTYWVRICALQADKQCSNYSNAVKVYIRN